MAVAVGTLAAKKLVMNSKTIGSCTIAYEGCNYIVLVDVKSDMVSVK